MGAGALLEINGLRVAFPIAGREVEALRGVGFEVAEGEAVGLVGESGSGKSLTALAVLRLVEPPGRISGGKIGFAGRDFLELPESEMRRLRGRAISIVFQDSLTSLNPAFTVGQQLVDVIAAHQGLGHRAARRRAGETLELVGIPSSRINSYPYEFSGGMRQRALIAMAIACQPRLLIADEPTTALDVTVQAQIVALLDRLRRELRLSLLFITHNLDLMAELCDRVVVLYGGTVMETGPVETVMARPQHPYTRSLIDCVPRLEDFGRLPRPIPGQPPVLGSAAEGCPFMPRCGDAGPDCSVRPPLQWRERAHGVACWRAA